MRYWLGPWEYLTTPDTRPIGWNPPVGCIAALDLRSIESAGTTGGNPARNVGFFVMPNAATLPADFTLLGSGDPNEILPRTAYRNEWEQLLGWRPEGDSLADWIASQLTNGAEADASGGTGALTAGADGVARIKLRGRVFRRARLGRSILGAERWAQVLRSQYRGHFRRAWDRSPQVARKLLWQWWQKYRLQSDWAQLVPVDLRGDVPGPLEPTTTYSDDFNRASLGAAWTYFSGYQIYTSSGIGRAGGGFLQCEYASDLSSDDHWSEVTWTPSPSGRNFGPAVRSQDATSSTTQDFYYTQRFGGQTYITKIVNNGQTNLANATSSSTSAGDVDRLQADGSNLDAFTNGSNDVSTTDVILSGQLRAGLFVLSYAGDAFTSWQASDIAAGGSALPMAANHYRRMRA